MYSIGYDIGSSSVKAVLIDLVNGNCVASAHYPKLEMDISSPQIAWAEQDPELWWKCLKIATAELLEIKNIPVNDIKSIGISYQMHGLVVVDKAKNVLRPSIIWCDSRAVDIGNKAFEEIGKKKCLEYLLNSPGNFTASKLKWVKENEPELFQKIDKMMLPGDFIAMKLTGNITTTNTGLSEGILWDFKNDGVAKLLLNHYGICENLIPELVPVFSNQGSLTKEAANELQLHKDIIVSYRGGDQPNNAFSLNVLKPGEVAATAGTSGVVYGITDKVKYDPLSRVNTFAHVNHKKEHKRLGVLLCVNGTGILNSWLKTKLLNNQTITYSQMNEIAMSAPIGSEGLSVLPFGNGAERILQNKNIGAHFCNINFNRHQQAHIIRGSQEGIVFSLNYGLEMMRKTGVDTKIIRAGECNMFLSPLFSSAFATLTGAVVELYNTNGAQGAALGAGIGLGYYKNTDEAFSSLKLVQSIEPNQKSKEEYLVAYNRWKQELNKKLELIEEFETELIK